MKCNNGTSWTPFEIEQFKSLANSLPLREVAALLNRSFSSVRAMSYRLQLGKRSVKSWSAFDEGELRGYAGLYSAEEIACKLGRSVYSIKGKAKQLGIQLYQVGERHHCAIHSDEDVTLCRQLYDAGVTPKVIAEKMEISHGTVNNFIFRHRLTANDQAWRKFK
ncbi:hypothetical protein Q3V30_20755 [Erwinia pyri]|uniref:Uncharacterized protein n=1 Tax=Erwinia pyri TaxID=3062598 RepID=A0AA50DJ70_9GAMM|nr:hypothetical protein [Erwinia sp. DE2]WLS78820.1 hypothetical protein Q3V30_20755 [Erwinia sp. DE2]